MTWWTSYNVFPVPFSVFLTFFIMERQWLRKVGDIGEYLSTKAASTITSINFNRQWQSTDGDNNEFRLNESLVGVSPTGDLIVLVKRTRCCVLTRSSVSKSGKDFEFHLKTTIDLSGAPNTSNDLPTSIICLPVASQKVSTHGQSEWTCIAVGYRSGLLQMFTENGIYLFGQAFGTKPVVQLKCRTQHWLNTQCGNVAEPGDDFSMLYADGVLVTIDGFGLFQLLRVVYAQQALRPASAPINPASISHNMLSFTKWKFSEVDNVNDFVTCGIRPMTELNALFYATFLNGAEIYSSNQLSHFVTAGSMPFVGTWIGQERRQSGSLIQDVTTAVTNKIVSSVAGLLSWSRQTDQQKYSSSSTDEANAAQEAPKLLNLKNYIFDRPRVGQCIAASPNHRLAAVTDNFNRIYVFDLELGVIVKQFKGYREAQIGWVRSVQADSSPNKQQESRNLRATQFLVIHSPRRSQLEIWGGERWERIHIAEIAPNSRLIYTPHGMLGWTRSMVNDPIDSELGSCFLLSSDGTVSTIEVAFHWAVADRNRAKLLDQSLIRDLENALKAGKTQLYPEIIAKMQLDETRENSIQLLIRHFQKAPSQLLSVVNDLLPIAKRLPAEEGQRFQMLCSKTVAAVNLHTNLDSLLSTTTRSMLKTNPGVTLDAILSTFCLRVNEKDSYRQIFETYCLVNGMRMSDENQRQKPLKLIEFMELLGILTRPSISQQSSDVLLGAYIFGTLFSMDDFADRCHQFDSTISLFACQLFKPIDLLRFLLSYFFSPLSPWLAVEHLSLLVSILQMLSRLIVGDNRPFWSLCHKMCADSFAHVKALTVALVSSQMSVKNQPVASEEQSSLLEMAGDWESDISVNALLLEAGSSADNNGSLGNSATGGSSSTTTIDEWTQLCTQLTVLSLFEMLVSCNSNHLSRNQLQNEENEATTDGWDTDVQDIGVIAMPQLSSSMIAECGIDLLCEHVCRWVVASKFDIQAFFARVDVSSSSSKSQSPQKLLTVESTIDHLLARLIAILPVSLSCDQLYASCSWESAISWSRQEFVGNQPYLLEASLQYANLISNVRLRCWLLPHIWAKLVRPVFQNVFNVTLKFDRSPKDVELGDGLTELSAEQLSAFTAQLFEVLINSSEKMNEAMADDSKMATEQAETVWPKPSQDKGRISLADQAAAADVTLNNKGCLNLHLEAAIVLRIIIHFRMKPAGLDHLFSHIEQSILFQDLFSAPTPPAHVLDYVMESRCVFITRITKAILLAVKPPTLTLLLTNCPYYDQWNEISLRLVDFWLLDRSLICGRQVAMLCCVSISEELVQLAEKYSGENGFEAVRFWPPIISAIGNHIARIVYQNDRGARSQALRNRLDAFTPELVRWLADCLNDQEIMVLASAFGEDRHGFNAATTRSLPVSSRLLSLALSQLPDSYSHYAITLALCELVGTIQEESSM